LSQDTEINELNQDLVHTNLKNAQTLAALLLVEIQIHVSMKLNLLSNGSETISTS